MRSPTSLINLAIKQLIKHRSRGSLTIIITCIFGYNDHDIARFSTAINKSNNQLEYSNNQPEHSTDQTKHPNNQYKPSINEVHKADVEN